jgi:hypothetical protein
MSPRLRTLRRRAATRAQHALALAGYIFVTVVIAALTGACGSSADLVTGPSETKCQVVLDVPSTAVDPGGGTIGIAVRTQAECTWTASSTASWVASVTPASGQGNGEVRVQVAANPLPSTRQAEVIVNNSRASLQQAAAACRFDVTPLTRVVAAASATGTFSVATLAGCSWSAVSDAEWIRIESGGSGVGPGDVTFAVTVNEGPGRSGSLTIAGATVTLTQEAALVEPAPPAPAPTPAPTPTPPAPTPSPVPGCNFDITPSAATIAATGGSQRFAVAAQSGCGWAAASSVSWITILSGATGVGPGVVELLIAPNTGGARTATVVIAGRQVSVAQAAATSPDPAPTPTPTPPPPSPTPPPPTCTYAVAPADASVAAAGGAGSPITVTTTTGCTWTAAATVTWLAIASGATGSGAGTVTFTAEANTGPQRMGALTVAGHTVAVTQAAPATPCTYQVSPLQQSIAAVGGAGAPFGVTTASGCTWTAATTADWITITSAANQVGTGSVTFTVAANTGVLREGTLTIAGQTVTVSQAAPPATPPACVSSLSPTSDTVGLAGAAGRSLMVRAPNSCNWTAMSSDPWLTITSGSSGSGNGKVDYSVAPLTTGSRTATISIGGQTFTLTQSGPTP